MGLRTDHSNVGIDRRSAGRSRVRAAGLGLVALLTVAACASGGGSRSASSVGSSDGGDLAATGAAVSVPITTTAHGSHNIVSVQISVGGGDPVPVMLDTGSAGLLLDASAAGAQTSATGGPFTQNYASGPVSGSLGSAVVTIGELSTPTPITVGLVDASSAPTAFATGMKGILGVATTNGSGQAMLAPNLQLAPPYNAGSTLQVAGTAGATGTWSLGPVTPPAGATSIPLVAQTPGSSATPEGFPAFAKDVNLCWTIGSKAASCGPTDLDTGMDTPALNATTYSADGPVHTVLPSGQSITVAPPNGSALWSFTTGQTVGTDAVKLSSLGEETQFNTGLPFFYGRTIAWNYAGGELLIGSSS